MMKQTNTKLLGLFVVGGIALLVIGILVFGGARFSKNTIPHVAYFNEPLTGLAEGGPLNFRGVKVGTITKIVFEYDRRDIKFATPVYFEIDTSRFVETSESPLSREEGAIALIEKGLRAQLGTPSLVTGQRPLTLVIRPDTAAKLVGDQKPGLEIPAIASETTELKTTLTGLLNKIATLNIAQLNDDIHAALTGFTNLVANPEIAEIINGANLTVPDVRRLINNIDQEIDPLAGSFRGAADQAAGTFETVNGTLAKADGAVIEARKSFTGAQGTLRRGDKFLDSATGLVQPGSQPFYELNTMMREITAAARSIRSLATTLERDPGSLLFGRQRGRSQ